MEVTMSERWVEFLVLAGAFCLLAVCLAMLFVTWNEPRECVKMHPEFVPAHRACHHSSHGATTRCWDVPVGYELECDAYADDEAE